MRLTAMNTLENRATDLIDAIAAAMAAKKGEMQSSGSNVKLVFSVPADSTAGLPAVTGDLSLTGQLNSAVMTIRTAEFTSTDPSNDLRLLFKGAISYQPATGALAGKLTEISAFSDNGASSLVVTGAYRFTSSADVLGRIDGIQYTEAGLTTELRGRLSMDEDQLISGMVRSLVIYDSNTPADKISWSGKFDYAKLVSLSASVNSVAGIFSDQAMAPLFAGRDVFDIQSKDTLSSTGQSVQTKWLGHAGNDLMRGGAGREWFEGGSGHDRLEGGESDDVLFGGDGNDRLSGGEGADRLSGDGGNDWLEGGDGSDYLLGGAGNDRLVGGAAKDHMGGGAGNDRVEGGDGDDAMTGGAGNDVLVDLQGNNAIEDDEGHNHIKTGAGNDMIDTRGSGSNKINAGDGDNEIASGSGNDKIVTGKGNDDITGGGGNDLIHAGAGNDRIDAGAGVDRVLGGAGADHFLMSTLGDSAFVRILDFKATDGDRMVFDTSVFTGLSADTLADQFVATATGAATTAEQRVIFDTRNGKLYYDADGSGSLQADHLATLIGSTLLSTDQILFA